ncbi:uncharacterized protein LTR77_004019 [Saxophila tyrrhenica]|uniref:Ketoreductase domain-containing protein n=1 Tax=Saxophila tyrrhenica TaxID=1690608 RepID=A0AAV9PER3_9PEZI|nr:hypothetical protein LTR77_004019 [Saxophila tyrrhenica]
MHIKDRTFIVSGGASGLGLATVEDLHAHGGYIAIIDINAETGSKTVERLGERVKFYEADSRDTTALEAAVNHISTWTKQTNAPIGGVIPAAGVGFPAKLVGKNNEPVDMSALDFVLNINLRGVLDLLRLCLPHMTINSPTQPDGERGVLVLVSSSAAFDGQPGQVAYAASKGAIRSMTLVLARDLAQNGIRCNAIAPSYFESAMTAQMSDKVRKSLEKVFEFPKRPGQAHEFASTVRFCVENAMMNGMPPKWVGISDSVTISPDSGTRFIDQNASRWPDAPMDPAIRAVLALEPDFSLEWLDIVTDRSILAAILELCILQSEGREHQARDLEFGIQFVGSKTLVFVRTDVTKGKNKAGYREEFEKVSMQPHEGFEDCQGHHRVVQLDVGSLRVLMRHGADAYVEERDLDLERALGKLEPRNNSSRKQVDNMTITRGGALLPLSVTLELTTAKKPHGGRYNARLDAKLRETYLSGASYFVSAEHFPSTTTGQEESKEAVFDKRNLWQCNETAAGSGKGSFAEVRKDALKLFCDAVKDIRDRVLDLEESGEGRQYMVRYTEMGFRISSSDAKDVRGLSSELCEEW